MSPAPELEIPLWATRCDNRRRRPSAEKDAMIIPLAVKASAPVESYISTLAWHQASSATDLASRRGRALVEAAFEESDDAWDLRKTGAPVRAPSTAASESGSESCPSEPASSSEGWQRPDSHDSPGEQRAAPGQAARLAAAIRAAREARLGAGRRRAALAAEGRPALGGAGQAAAETSPTREEPTFSAFVSGLCGGIGVEVGELRGSTQVAELCQCVADAHGIPCYAVRLMTGDRVLHMSQPGLSLDAAGVQGGCELTLVKNWGWSKPDLNALTELLKQ